jgi:hypothetical protein
VARALPNEVGNTVSNSLLADKAGDAVERLTAHKSLHGVDLAVLGRAAELVGRLKMRSIAISSDFGSGGLSASPRSAAELTPALDALDAAKVTDSSPAALEKLEVDLRRLSQGRAIPQPRLQRLGFFLDQLAGRYEAVLFGHRLNRTLARPRAK